MYAPQSCHFLCCLVMSSSCCVKLIFPCTTQMPESSCAFEFTKCCTILVFLNASWSCGLAICQKLILPCIPRILESSSCDVEGMKLYKCFLVIWGSHFQKFDFALYHALHHSHPKIILCSVELTECCTIVSFPMLTVE